MKYYSVFDVTPTTDAWIPTYRPVADKLIAQYGGKYLARTATHEQVEGDSKDVALRIIIEWPSKENALNFMKDDEYLPYLKARTNGSISNHYLIEATDDLA